MVLQLLVRHCCIGSNNALSRQLTVNQSRPVSLKTFGLIVKGIMMRGSYQYLFSSCLVSEWQEAQLTSEKRILERRVAELRLVGAFTTLLFDSLCSNQYLSWLIYHQFCLQGRLMISSNKGLWMQLQRPCHTGRIFLKKIFASHMPSRSILRCLKFLFLSSL